MTAAGPDRERLLLVALALSGIAVLVLGSVVGAVAPGAAFGGTSEETNSSHTDPRSLEEEGDLSAVERQLADRLASRARDGSISSEDAQRARDAVNGTQYEALMEQYADVAEETGRTDRAEAFRRVQNRQIRFNRAVQQYWQQHGRYESAQFGTVARQRVTYGEQYQPNVSTPREAARTLEGDWRTVRDRRTALLAAYDELSTVTESESSGAGENFSPAMRSVNRTFAEVNETQQTVRDEQFVETELTVEEPSDRDISFTDPLEVSGQLTTADGRPIADQETNFSVGNRTYTTTTDANGTFTLTYHPTTVSANASNVTVRYVPGNESVHLGSEQTIDVDVSQVQPDVSVSVEPDRVAYNETLQVSGRIGTEAAGAANVSYLVTIDGHVVAFNRTDTDGRFSRNVSLPAGVPDGDRTVRVVLPADGQALSSANGSAAVTVTESPTDLAVDVTHVEDRTIRVSGTLTLADGQPVSDQRVEITANGSALGTVTTGPVGGFEDTLVVPEEAVTAGLFASTATVDIQSHYEDSSTNLGDASARGSVSLSSAPIGLWAVGGVGVLVLGVVGAVAVRRLGGRGSIGDGPDPDGPVDESILQATDSTAAPDEQALLEYAREQLATGDVEGGVSMGYVALRRRFASEIGRDALTPWEFYSACVQADVDEDALETLRRLTELYERARFRVESPAVETADSVLEQVAALVDVPADQLHSAD